ncbi:hypothetical protein LPC08_04250 [Roseomonas sp. OT10]|uniref:hypothetical protein n=1 Tax=Roseomonas cutis TaxID=2897332 RepID=UPI001E6172CB|nr:hypothetical protein [Roseomonas sp. OT10]UFN49862.1 hypothetical protein LPC08_04250 [Roseomonas sp. OT10]
MSKRTTYGSATAAALVLALASWGAAAQQPTPPIQPPGADTRVPTALPGVGASPMDQSNSASARSTGRGLGTVPTTQNTPGASPMDQSRSASASGNPRVRVNRGAGGFGSGGPQVNDGNSVSATGGPGTGQFVPRSRRRGVAPEPAPAAAPAAPAPTYGSMPAHTGSMNSAFMGGGGVFERGPDGTLRPVN